MVELEHFVLSYRGFIYENEHFGDNVITLLDYIYNIVLQKKIAQLFIYKNEHFGDNVITLLDCIYNIVFRKSLTTISYPSTGREAEISIDLAHAFFSQQRRFFGPSLRSALQGRSGGREGGREGME